MHVHVVRNYNHSAVVSSPKSDDKRQYILRLQDNWMASIHGLHFTETFGDGTGIRSLSLQNGAIVIRQSVGLDNTGIATCPQRRAFGFTYLFHRPDKMYLLHHDGVEVLRQAELVPEDKKVHVYSKYVAYTDQDLTVYSSDSLSVVTHQVSRNQAVQRTIDVIKRVIVVHPDFYIQDVLFSLLREPYTDVFPVKGQLIKFDRDRHTSDVQGLTTLHYSYYLPVIEYYGASQAVRERLLASQGRKVSLLVTLPKPAVAYVGTAIVQGRQLVVYQLRSILMNTKQYHLIEIAFDGLTPFVNDSLTFHV